MRTLIAALAAAFLLSGPALAGKDRPDCGLKVYNGKSVLIPCDFRDRDHEKEKAED